MDEIEIFKKNKLMHCYECTKFLKTFPSCACVDKRDFILDVSTFV